MVDPLRTSGSGVPLSLETQISLKPHGSGGPRQKIDRDGAGDRPAASSLRSVHRTTFLIPPVQARPRRELQTIITQDGERGGTDSELHAPPPPLLLPVTGLGGFIPVGSGGAGAEAYNTGGGGGGACIDRVRGSVRGLIAPLFSAV